MRSERSERPSPLSQQLPWSCHKIRNGIPLPRSSSLLFLGGGRRLRLHLHCRHRHQRRSRLTFTVVAATASTTADTATWCYHHHAAGAEHCGPTRVRGRATRHVH
ncbi:Uncharacterized protein FWK35_00008667 [Aphis craccivora]|uniref:Uncharacterized protein n=1 Tax=Aphis craccivora TaxID=307492 RepID=A0A6G0ZPB8_APHCR|nr:Uncharacterized protein FWK35_00008667 [Aphis craccivora]